MYVPKFPHYYLCLTPLDAEETAAFIREIPLWFLRGLGGIRRRLIRLPTSNTSQLVGPTGHDQLNPPGGARRVKLPFKPHERGHFVRDDPGVVIWGHTPEQRGE